MSLIEHYSEIVRLALTQDVAIICDAPTKAYISTALLQQDALRSSHAKGEALLFVVREDAHAAMHRSYLAGSNIRSRIVLSNTVAAMTQSLWAGLLSQTQVIITSCQALLFMVENGVLELEKVAMILLDSCDTMMLGDRYHRLIAAFSTTSIRPALVAFAQSAESGMQNLLMAIPLSIVTASIDGTLLGDNTNQVCQLVRCDGTMGTQGPLDDSEAFIEEACNELADIFRGYALLAPAVEFYEYARAHLGLWCSAHVWGFSLQVLREVTSSMPPSELPINCSGLLEATEHVVHGLETSFPWPTVKSTSEKLRRLVAVLGSTGNGVRPALVLVNSCASVMVIARFLERAWGLDGDNGMYGARVASFIGTCDPSIWPWMIESFKNGEFNILVTSTITPQDLPTDFYPKVVQFDVAALWSVEDLAHQLMVVRSSHPLAGFLGGNVIKCMVNTDVFVANLSDGPSELTLASRQMYRFINHSDEDKASLGMTYLADGLAGAFRSLADSHPQFPMAWNRVSFEAKYRKGLIKQHALYPMTPSMAGAIAAIQIMIGYRFSDVRTLISALSLGTPECERLEFVGDAALDLVAAKHWIDEHPTTQRGKVAAIKSASVCNNFLGMVCIELGLLQLINSSCPAFHHRGLSQALHWHTTMLALNQTGDFWMEVDYPKSLADSMEALFGAVYVDAAFNLGSVASVFDTLLLPSIQRLLSIDTVVFSVASLSRRCRHFRYAYTPGLRAQDGTPTTECTMTLNGVVLEKATRANRQLARRAVCRMVMVTLKSNPDALAGVCPCFAS
ncbi:MAG: hypothetical protein J3Q66DRAFT_439531 [Benniella sp.]|nr:MAG: hypothetical protein J3Q66DRAFT_439531 [Benniella sp.]